MPLIRLNPGEIPAAKIEAVCKAICNVMGGSVFFIVGNENFIYGQS